MGFNPRAPRGARQIVCAGTVGRIGVSIRAPRVGRDRRISHVTSA